MENKSVFHTLRVTPTEAAELVEHAAACGLSVSALLRARALGHPLPKGSAPAVNLTAWRELSGLAGRLNQIAHHANEQRVIEGNAVLDLVQVQQLLVKTLSTLQLVRQQLLGAA